MENGGVTHYNILANNQRMPLIGDVQNRAVLDIGSGSDPDPVNVAARRGMKPEGGVVADRNPAYENRRGSHEDAVAQLRHILVVGKERHSAGPAGCASESSMATRLPQPRPKRATAKIGRTAPAAATNGSKRADRANCMNDKNTAVDIVIPAHNEAASLPHVLRSIPHPPVGRVVVCDNGSLDDTARVAKEGGAIVVEEPRKGYGQACLTALEYLRHNEPPAIVVFLDADFSDHPEELPSIIEPILDGKADLVIGSRTRGEAERGALLPQARFGNWIACHLIRMLYRVACSDLGPFRAIRWSALEELSMVDRDFGWTAEMQVKAARRGLRIVEVPVRYRRRIGRSKISGTLRGTILAGCKILWTVLRYSWGRDGTRPPSQRL